VRVGRGEIDLLVSLGGTRIAVEVKSGIGQSDPVHHFDDAKAAQVRSLAVGRSAYRVDYIGVAFTRAGALVRWLPAVA